MFLNKVMKNKFDAEQIIKELGIEEEIVAIYPYGSQVYGTASMYSDHDYILVAKNSMLNSGAFKNNAVSNANYTIQGTLYSRGGFQDAINKYEMPAMECLSLTPEQIILKKWPFKVQKWDDKEMIDNVIKLASASRHVADKQAKTGEFGEFKDRAKRGMYHALRILMFGEQLKEHQKIVDFTASNDLHARMMAIDDDDFDTRDWYELFDELAAKLKS
jgi:hypothetical protein